MLNYVSSLQDGMYPAAHHAAHPDHRRHASLGDPSAALRDFESELGGGGGVSGGRGGGTGHPQQQHGGGGGDVLMRTYEAPGSALSERAHALRVYCASALGPQLFDLIYGVLRRRVAVAAAAGGGAAAAGGGEEAAFRQDLQARLGPGRMQYVALIDQLIYCEDSTY